MKISNNKNIPLLSKNSDNISRQKPSFSPRIQRVKQVQQQQSPSYQSPTNRLSHRNLASVSPIQLEINRPNAQLLRQTNQEYKIQGMSPILKEKNLKVLDSKTIQLAQFKHNIRQQNEYENIVKFSSPNQQFSPRVITPQQSPNAIYALSPQPRSSYPIKHTINQNAFGVKNIYTLASNQVDYQGNSKKSSISKDKVLSTSSMKRSSLKNTSNMAGSSKMGFKLLKKNLTLQNSKQQQLGMESERSKSSNASQGLSTNRMINAKKLKKIKQKIGEVQSQIKIDNSDKINRITVENQYFGNIHEQSLNLHPQLSSKSQKKKNNFLRLSKSLENNSSIKSKINLQSRQSGNKISFDKMYDDEDFELRNQIKDSQFNSIDKQSMQNSEKDRKILTSMQSQLKKRKKSNPKTINSRVQSPNVHNGIQNTLNQQNANNRLKSPSFRIDIPTNQLHQTFYISNEPKPIHSHNQYIIGINPINIQEVNQPHITFKIPGSSVQKKSFVNNQNLTVINSVNRSSIRPVSAQNSLMPVKSSNNHLNVIQFGPKSPVKVMQQANHGQTGQKGNANVIVNYTNQFQRTDNFIARPQSAMCRISQSNLNRPKSVHEAPLLKNGSKVNVNFNQNKQIFILPSQRSNIPNSQSIPLLSHLQQVSQLQKKSHVQSKLVPIQQPNMNSNMLQMNSVIGKKEELQFQGPTDNLRPQFLIKNSTYQNTNTKVDNNAKLNEEVNTGQKSIQENMSPSSTSIHGISSIIMNMKSYNLNNGTNSYFNQTNEEQNTQKLAYNQFQQNRDNRKNNHIQLYSKPSSSSSKNSFKNAQNTLPVDSKPNSPQHSFLKSHVSLVQGNIIQKQQSVIQRNKGFRPLSHSEEKLTVNSSLAEKNIYSNSNSKPENYIQESLNQAPPFSPIQQYYQGQNQQNNSLMTPSIHSIPIVQNSYESHNSYFQQGNQNPNQANIQAQPNQNKVNLLHINNPQGSVTKNNLINTHNIYQGLVQNDKTHPAQQWLNINREKYSTSEYLNIKQVKQKFNLVPNQTAPEQNHIPYVQRKGQFNHDQKQFCINMVNNPMIHQENPKYPIKNDKFSSKNNVNSKNQEIFENYDYIVVSEKYPNYPASFENKNLSQEQMKKLKQIENQHQQFRTKINSISQNLLSMTPMKLSGQISNLVYKPNNEPQVYINSSNINSYKGFESNNHTIQVREQEQQRKIDQTAQYGQNQCQMQEPSYDDVQYEYSDDQQSYQKGKKKQYSACRPNGDLSDTKKITYQYGNQSKSKKSSKSSRQKYSNVKQQQNQKFSSKENSTQRLKRQQMQNRGIQNQDLTGHTKQKRVHQIMISNSNFDSQQNQYHKLPKPSFHQISSNGNIQGISNKHVSIQLGGNNLTESVSKQNQLGQRNMLYTPIQSSEIIELSSLNSLSFHFVATNYQPSKSSFNAGSILTSSKANNFLSSKNLQNHQKMTRSNNLRKSKNLNQNPIQQQSLYRPIPFSRTSSKKHFDSSNSIQERSEQDMIKIHKNQKIGQSLIHKQKLKQSQYSIAQDSVNYVPINKNNIQHYDSNNQYGHNNKNQDFHTQKHGRKEYSPQGVSSSTLFYHPSMNGTQHNSGSKGKLQCIVANRNNESYESQVPQMNYTPYYESRYEYCEGSPNSDSKLNKHTSSKTITSRVQESDGSSSNVVETLKFYQNTGQVQSFYHQE